MLAEQGANRPEGPFDDALVGGGSWSRRLDALQAAVPAQALRFAPALGHAFDYYDGLMFEVRSEALGTGQPLAAGGRYDGLLARLGDVSVPAVGFAVWIERLAAIGGDR